jgi:MFS family permease
VLRLPSIGHLAPVWLCVNAVVGLWLGPTLPFLLTQRSVTTQYLAGLFAADPARVGWMLFGYAMVFGAGVTAWSFVLPHVRLRPALWIAVGAMLPACAAIYLLNHSAHQPASARWVIGGILALIVMVESGFTPAALAWLAGGLPLQSGRGAAMGIYSVLLSVGAIIGSLLAALLGQLYSIDGLLFGTVLVAGLALILIRWIPNPRPLSLEANA